MLQNFRLSEIRIRTRPKIRYDLKNLKFVMGNALHNLIKYIAKFCKNF